MRRLVAGILGLLGVAILVDVAVITLVAPEAKVDGFRQVLLVIIGALLVLSGAVTFSWPRRGAVETTADEPTPAPGPTPSGYPSEGDQRPDLRQ